MIVKQYVKDFENMGFGMFVHFGLYSVIGKGEWSKHTLGIPDEEYYATAKEFNPKPNWAEELVLVAKGAGCKYVTLTTRHHDGFSLYDTCGLNENDAPHAKCGRDLVREFVDACRKHGIVPFFYHTLLDWWHPDYNTDFPAYLKYLRASVEILCKNYGKIGGLWFDGKWSKPGEDWEEDALYSLIRSYQPEAMIINNTGLGARGEAGHIELDSVTFERGRPHLINMEGAPKYIASEMCEVFSDIWGYGAEDFNYNKSPAKMIKELAECRRYGSNMLMNVGPMGDGSVTEIDKAILGVMGRWVNIFDEAIRHPKPVKIDIEGKPDDFILKGDGAYYLFCMDLPMRGDGNVTIEEKASFTDKFSFDEKIESIVWMDNGAHVDFLQNGSDTVVYTVPYTYGRNFVVRVAKIVCK